jgi:hypothetical protein
MNAITEVPDLFPPVVIQPVKILEIPRFEGIMSGNMELAVNDAIVADCVVGKPELGFELITVRRIGPDIYGTRIGSRWAVGAVAMSEIEATLEGLQIPNVAGINPVPRWESLRKRVAKNLYMRGYVAWFGVSAARSGKEGN